MWMRAVVLRFHGLLSETTRRFAVGIVPLQVVVRLCGLMRQWLCGSGLRMRQRLLAVGWLRLCGLMRQWLCGSGLRMRQRLLFLGMRSTRWFA
jgi:hypothetical protein